MELLLQEIEGALEAKLFYLAVAMTLTLPDTCAALSSPTGSTDSKAYKKWYVDNLSALYPQITPVDMWNLRNAVLHQGRFHHKHTQYSRFVFTLPHPQNIMIESLEAHSTLSLDAALFCRKVVAAARDWYSAHKNDPHVIANQPHLVQFRPDGVAPLYKGLPVIA